jgi:hypothetical protein
MDFFETEWERPEFDSVPSLAENMVYLLRDCDDVLVRKTLQATYRDFCKRSAALRTWRKIELEAHETHYPVAPILSGEIDCVTQVMRDGRHPLRQGCDWKVIGDPPFVELPFAKSIIEPDTAVEDVPPEFVIVEAVEIPHISEERAPRSFLRRYGDAIVDGALARLFSMTNRPWSDPEQARQHGIAYSNALSEARLRSANGGPAANAGKSLALDMSGMI